MFSLCVLSTTACAAQCPETCNYVSFSATNQDCSWYSECDMAALVPGGQASNYYSVRVRNATHGSGGRRLVCFGAKRALTDLELHRDFRCDFRAIALSCFFS